MQWLDNNGMINTSLSILILVLIIENLVMPRAQLAHASHDAPGRSDRYGLVTVTVTVARLTPALYNIVVDRCSG